MIDGGIEMSLLLLLLLQYLSMNHYSFNYVELFTCFESSISANLLAGKSVVYII